jgi:hypothetical protein
MDTAFRLLTSIPRLKANGTKVVADQKLPTATNGRSHIELRVQFAALSPSRKSGRHVMMNRVGEEKFMKKLSTLGMIIGASLLWATPVSLHWSPTKALQLSVDGAQAQIGRDRPYYGYGGYHRPYYAYAGYRRPYYAYAGYRPYYGYGGYHRPYYAYAGYRPYYG